MVELPLNVMVRNESAFPRYCIFKMNRIYGKYRLGISCCRNHINLEVSFTNNPAHQIITVFSPKWRWLNTIYKNFGDDPTKHIVWPAI